MAGIMKRAIKAVEPWYNWGTIYVERLDAATEAEMSEGEARFFDIQWFGLHLSIHIGRTPSRLGAAEIAGRHAHHEEVAERRRCRDALRIAWEEALAEYRSLRATSDALPLGAENEDAAVDACLDAMDRLLVETPAPDLRAVSIKMELAQERYDGSGHIPAFADAIRADVGRLQREGC